MDLFDNSFVLYRIEDIANIIFHSVISLVQYIRCCGKLDKATVYTLKNKSNKCTIFLAKKTLDHEYALMTFDIAHLALGQVHDTPSGDKQSQCV